MLNASFAIFATGITDDIFEAKKLAEDSIDMGKAREKLDALLELSRENYN